MCTSKKIYDTEHRNGQELEGSRCCLLSDSNTTFTWRNQGNRKQLQTGESVSRFVFEMGTSGNKPRTANSSVMVQAVNCQLLTARIRIASQVSLCGICRGQSVIETGLSLNIRFFPVSITIQL